MPAINAFQLMQHRENQNAWAEMSQSPEEDLTLQSKGKPCQHIEAWTHTQMCSEDT